MNLEAMAAHLKDGALIRILTRGQEKPARAWIEEYCESFYIHDSVPKGKTETVGGSVIPTLAVTGNSINPEKTDEVVNYLIESYGFSMRQATSIVSEAT